MDTQYLTDRHVVARFLADQLTEEEALAFADYRLRHPEVVRDLEAAARLKVGLDRLRESGELAVLLQAKPKFPQRTYAWAASFAILAVITLVLLRSAPTEPSRLFAATSALVDRTGHVLPTGQTYALLRTRSTDYDAVIALPPTAQVIALRVMPDFIAHPARYRIALGRLSDDDSLHTVGSLAGLPADEAGFVAVYFDSSMFTPGRYRLSVQGEAGTDAAETVTTFKIRLTTPIGE